MGVIFLKNFSKVYSAQPALLNARRVDVEVDISPGLHTFNIVGLPDKAVDEARDRVSSAIKNSGFVSPKQKNHKIIVSLAPADIRKTGPTFDLAIAVGYLKSTKQIDFDSERKLFVGELSLDGKLRPMNGIVPIMIFAKKAGFTEIFMPKSNAVEAGLVDKVKIFGAESLDEVLMHLRGKKEIEVAAKTKTAPGNLEVATRWKNETEWGQIFGQEKAKRGLLIAAAGGHNIAFYGPPGTGKTMLANSLVGLLPGLDYEKIIECTSIHSVLTELPPFRSPHHTSSHTAIVGGGVYMKPGEITLAHNGVLFLDEFPEFNRQVVESLREPLERGSISISRTHEKITLPSNFILVVAMNPCPCGYFETGIKPCVCTPHNINRYRKKISGPIVDRIDMWIEISNISFENLDSAEKSGANLKNGSDFMKVKSQVIMARKIQQLRFNSHKLNKEIPVKKIPEYCAMAAETKNILKTSAETLKLSMRGYYKIIKLARTIADLDSKNKGGQIKKEHILEALQYRPKIN